VTEDIISWLLNLERSKGICLGLERINKALNKADLSRLGNIIHIGGTNGKASTLTFLKYILLSANYKVATYTSPHLLSVTERIRINNNNIPEEELREYTEANKEKIERLGLTFFEAITMLAFLYIINNKPDFTICEVGLAGRYDATNIIDPIISIITQIDYDHTDFLGNDLFNIAYEEAGIIKENRLCLTAVKDEKLLDILKKEANDKNAALYTISNITVDNIKNIKIRISGTSFDLESFGQHYKALQTNLIGRCQAENAALAV